jgi:hypothetical protein
VQKHTYSHREKNELHDVYTKCGSSNLQNACKYFLMESGFALFIAFLINVAVVSVSGTVCSADNLSPKDSEKCGDLTLNSASFLLKV